MSAQIVAPFKELMESSPADEASTDTRQRTLLIVDDEEGPRLALRVLFKDQYNVLMASNGNTALELARDNFIDAAVLDIKMEGMTGVELLAELKKVDPNIEIIMFTAYETMETMKQSFRYGAIDYINKPFDISEMRAAVAKAMERRKLHAEIFENNDELAKLQEELNDQQLKEEISRTRADIYSDLVHDINGPLTIVHGFVQILLSRIGKVEMLEGENLDILKDRMERINRQLSTCIEISQRYLSFLRGTAQDQSSVMANRLLLDVGEFLRVNKHLRQNKLEVAPLETDVRVKVNGVDFIQIIHNLAVNALQCDQAPHQVVVSGRVLKQPVQVDSLQDGPRCRVINRDGFANGQCVLAVTVQDDGPGIPEEVVGRLFNEQFTTKPVGQGTGRGLGIVKRFVENARGLLHLQTEPGNGTNFTVYLPATTASD